MKGTTMKLHFREAFTNFATEFKSDHNVRKDIGLIVSAVPSVILSIAAIRELGLKDASLKPFKYGPVIRNHKAVTVLFVGGIAYALAEQCAAAVYRNYQDWKSQQVPEIPTWAEVPEPTKGEVWAADLAEGDVTIFDRLMQVRAQATALLQAQGKDATPAPGNEYFDVELARQELSNMEPHDLEHIEETLNRRIMLLAADGEDVEIEEKRLHASLLILEEELDQRLLEDEHFDEEERLQREGAKLVHPAYQHQLKATHTVIDEEYTFTDMHLTAAQKRIAERFNTGASTTVADLTAEEKFVDAQYLAQKAAKDAVKIYSVSAIEEHLEKGPKNTFVHLVGLKRYSNRDNIGMNLVFHTQSHPGSRWKFHSRTVGLFTQADAEAGVAYFRALQSQEDLDKSGKFSDMEDDEMGYIRDQIIPVEWKRMTDAELDEVLYVHCGRTPMEI